MTDLLIVRLPAHGLRELVKTQPLLADSALQLGDLAGSAHVARHNLDFGGIELATDGELSEDVVAQVLLALLRVRGWRLDLAALDAADSVICQSSQSAAVGAHAHFSGSAMLLRSMSA